MPTWRLKLALENTMLSLTSVFVTIVVGWFLGWNEWVDRRCALTIGLDFYLVIFFVALGLLSLFLGASRALGEARWLVAVSAGLVSGFAVGLVSYFLTVPFWPDGLARLLNSTKHAGVVAEATIVLAAPIALLAPLYGVALVVSLRVVRAAYLRVFAGSGGVGWKPEA